MADEARARIREGTAAEVLLAFLPLGFTSFGGPVAHLGFFRTAFVERRRWLTDEAYADLVALCQFMPGPASSQVGMAIGLRRAGPFGPLRGVDRLHAALGDRARGLRPPPRDGGASPRVRAGSSASRRPRSAVVAHALLGMAGFAGGDAGEGDHRRRRDGPRCLLAPRPVRRDAPRDRGGGACGAPPAGRGAGRAGKRHLPASGEPAQWAWRRSSSSSSSSSACRSQPISRRRSTFSTAPIAPARSCSAAATWCCRSSRASSLGWWTRARSSPATARAQAVPGAALHLRRLPRRGGRAVRRPGGGRQGGARRHLPCPLLFLVLGVMPFWEDLRRAALARRMLAGVNAAVVGPPRGGVPRPRLHPRRRLGGGARPRHCRLRGAAAVGPCRRGSW